MLQRTLRHRAPVLWLLLPFMAGLGIAYQGSAAAPLPFTFSLAAAGLGSAVYWHRHYAVWAVGFCAALMALGHTYYTLRRDRLRAWENLPARETQLHIRVDRMFAPKPQRRAVSGVGHITQAPHGLREVVGQTIYFSLREDSPGSGPLIASTEIGANGVLAPVPVEAPVASFDNYLESCGVNFRFDRGRVREIVRAPTRYQRFCHATLVRFGAILSESLEKHPDLAAIIRGMLLGEVVDLTPAQHRLFVESGTLHLFSISGLHVAAIAIALHVLLGLFRLPRAGIFLVSSALLWLYADITGGSPSAVRAVVMVILFESAFVLRRPVNPVATLSCAAFLSLLANPMQLFGASFQMSYGIVAGLLLLGLPLSEYFTEKTTPFRQLPRVTWRLHHRLIAAAQRWLAGALGIGLATSLVSGVCGILYFQLFTPGALLANLLLIPISSLTLWSGFLSLLCGLMRLDGLGHVFNHSAALTLLIMERGIAILVALPGTFYPAHFTRAALGFSALALEIALLMYGYSSGWTWRRGGWLLPFGFFAAVLVAAVRFG